MRTLEEVLASGKFHPPSETNLRNAQAVRSRDTKEYLAHIVKRNVLREAILKAMADNRVDALAYPTIRRKANVIGEMQVGHQLPAQRQFRPAGHRRPGRLHPDGLPVGVELAGPRLERAAIDQIRLRLRAGHTSPPPARQHAGARPPLNNRQRR